MSVLDINTTVGQLVTERPGRARVFEQFGIDYCCGGKKPLAEVCATRGLDPQAVMDALIAHEQQTGPEERDWSQASLTELCDHIENTHHAYLKAEVPRLSAMVNRIAAVHGDHEPHLHQLADVFEGFRREIESHMEKEEQVLFPIIRRLEEAEQAGSCPSFHCGSINNPIAVMEHEHDSAGDALARMRALTHDYTPPSHACNTYRATLDGLSVLEHDMHRHVHKENSILFPRASALEAKLAGK